jgi:hypothetical protein
VGVHRDSTAFGVGRGVMSFIHRVLLKCGLCTKNFVASNTSIAAMDTEDKLRMNIWASGQPYNLRDWGLDLSGLALTILALSPFAVITSWWFVGLVSLPLTTPIIAQIRRMRLLYYNYVYLMREGKGLDG